VATDCGGSRRFERRGRSLTALGVAGVPRRLPSCHDGGPSLLYHNAGAVEALSPDLSHATGFVGTPRLADSCRLHAIVEVLVDLFQENAGLLAAWTTAERHVCSTGILLDSFVADCDVLGKIS